MAIYKEDGTCLGLGVIRCCPFGHTGAGPRSVQRSCGESRNMGCVAMRRTSPWSFLPFCDLLHFVDSFLCMFFFGWGEVLFVGLLADGIKTVAD